MMVKNNSPTKYRDAILLSANTGPDKFDFVQSLDGTVMILLNDEQMNGFSWDAGRVEEGVSAYLRFLADQPTAS